MSTFVTIEPDPITRKRPIGLTSDSDGSGEPDNQNENTRLSQRKRKRLHRKKFRSMIMHNRRSSFARKHADKNEAQKTTPSTTTDEPTSGDTSDQHIKFLRTVRGKLKCCCDGFTYHLNKKVWHFFILTFLVY